MFLLAVGLLLYSLQDAEGFGKIWRYFAWANQALAVFTLWAVTVWLVGEGKNYWVTFIPALFMTGVCTTYLCIAPEGLHISPLLFLRNRWRMCGYRSILVCGVEKERVWK